MEKMKLFIMSNRKAVIGGAVAAVLIICGAIGLYVTREQVTQKATDFDINVNTEVDTDITKYLDGVKNPEQVKVDWKTVDTTKIGNYDVTIKYKDNDYKVTFHVVDKEKPVIKLSKTEFVFPLGVSLDNVNRTINESIKITDNYDQKFDALNVITEIPTEEKEVIVKISVKDTSGNKSDEVSITAQFTEDGEEKNDLKKEKVTQGNTSTTKPSNSTGSNTNNGGNNNTPSTDGNTTNDGSNTDGGNGGSQTKPNPSPTPTPEPTPVPTPTPQPEPTPEPTPTPQPEPTPEPTPEPNYLCPNGVIDQMKPCDYYEIPQRGQTENSPIFSTEHEAVLWNNNAMNTGSATATSVRSIQVNNGSFVYVVMIWK